MKMLGFMDLGDAYASVCDADYGTAETSPTNAHPSHHLRWAPTRGWYCLGCEAKASWPLIEQTCPRRFCPESSSLTPARRKRAERMFDAGFTAAGVAAELGISRDQARNVERSLRTARARRAKRGVP